MTDAIGPARFGEQEDFALGVEEELLLVDERSRALSHTGVEVLARMDDAELGGFAHPTPTRPSSSSPRPWCAMPARARAR